MAAVATGERERTPTPQCMRRRAAQTPAWASPRPHRARSASSRKQPTTVRPSNAVRGARRSLPGLTPVRAASMAESSPPAAEGARASADARDAGAEVATPQRPGAAKRAKKSAQPLTVAEEAVTRRFWELRILSVGRDALNFDDTLVGTAVAAFKRFYLQHSLMEFAPLGTLTACLFLAIKLESNPFTERFTFAKRLVSTLDHVKSEDDLSEFEIQLLQGLNFHLMFFHPFRALRVRRCARWLHIAGYPSLGSARQELTPPRRRVRRVCSPSSATCGIGRCRGLASTR